MIFILDNLPHNKKAEQQWLFLNLNSIYGFQHQNIKGLFSPFYTPPISFSLLKLNTDFVSTHSHLE